MSQAKRTILVIDGKLVSRIFYTRLVESAFLGDVVTHHVETGGEGLDMCDRNTVDCVMIASELPDGNGIDFLKKLMVRMGEDREIPVVMLSDEDNEDEAKLAIKLGAFDYLVKGRFSQVSLVQALKNAIEAARLHRELAKSRMRLLDNAHKAGMAEIANGVLHNIGNNMNTVATSVDAIRSTIERSRIKGFRQANDLLENMGVLQEHPKGEDLIRYYRSLEQKWSDERESILAEARVLLDHVSHIRSDIYEQSHYANTELFLEELDANKIVIDALRLQNSMLDEEGVVVDERCQHIPRCMAVRVKLMLILNNLIRNSVESLGDRPHQQKLLTVGTHTDDPEVLCIYVKDNGVGIPEADRDKIFNYGFTTKKGAHGAGLHVAANAATEMKGKLQLVNSSMEGTTFELLLPLKEGADLSSSIVIPRHGEKQPK